MRQKIPYEMSALVSRTGRHSLWELSSQWGLRLHFLSSLTKDLWNDCPLKSESLPPCLYFWHQPPSTPLLSMWEGGAGRLMLEVRNIRNTEPLVTSWWKQIKPHTLWKPPLLVGSCTGVCRQQLSVCSVVNFPAEVLLQGDCRFTLRGHCGFQLTQCANSLAGDVRMFCHRILSSETKALILIGTVNGRTWKANENKKTAYWQQKKNVHWFIHWFGHLVHSSGNYFS